MDQSNGPPVWLHMAVVIVVSTAAMLLWLSAIAAFDLLLPPTVSTPVEN
ncbi:MAG TPA: hypothetical protein VFG15_16920 [Amycolatopsis sp.]|nr:hypothetical protein [Amycolatopsis sp.]